MISFVIIVTFIILYISSLWGCFKSQAECLNEVGQDTAVLIGYFIGGAASCFVLLTVLVYHKLIPSLYLLACVLIMAFLFYYYDTGSDLAHHGAYNRAFFYFFCLGIYLALGVLYLLACQLIYRPFTIIITILIAVAVIYFLVKETI